MEDKFNYSDEAWVESALGFANRDKNNILNSSPSSAAILGTSTQCCTELRSPTASTISRYVTALPFTRPQPDQVTRHRESARPLLPKPAPKHKRRGHGLSIWQFHLGGHELVERERRQKAPLKIGERIMPVRGRAQEQRDGVGQIGRRKLAAPELLSLLVEDRRGVI